MQNRVEAPIRLIEEKDSGEFFRSVGLVGLDMDDTTVEHDPTHLHLKLMSMLIHSKGSDTIDPTHYPKVAKDKKAADSYAVELGIQGAKLYGMTAAEFIQDAREWVTATLDHTVRDRKVVDRFGYPTKEAFWDEYNYFGKEVVPLDPLRYTAFTPGADDFLRHAFALREVNGMRIYVVSNSNRSRLEPRLEFIRRAGFPAFDGVVSYSSDFGVKKPDPTGLLHVASQVVLPEGAGKLYVGNGSEDIMAAHTAGWTPVMINAGVATMPHTEGMPHFQFRTMGDFDRHWQQKANQGK